MKTLKNKKLRKLRKLKNNPNLFFKDLFINKKIEFVNYVYKKLPKKIGNKKI